MKCKLARMLITLGILTLLTSGMALAQGRQGLEDHTPQVTSRVDGDTNEPYLEIAPNSLLVPEGQKLSRVILEFHAEVAPGQEVELWVGEPSSRPWSSPEVRAAHHRRVWVVDARTEDLVRFDVTGLVSNDPGRAQETRVFLLRLVDGDENEALPLLLKTGTVPRLRTRLGAVPQRTGN